MCCAKRIWCVADVLHATTHIPSFCTTHPFHFEKHIHLVCFLHNTFLDWYSKLFILFHDTQSQLFGLKCDPGCLWINKVNRSPTSPTLRKERKTLWRVETIQKLKHILFISTSLELWLNAVVLSIDGFNQELTAGVHQKLRVTSSFSLEMSSWIKLLFFRWLYATFEQNEM